MFHDLKFGHGNTARINTDLCSYCGKTHPTQVVDVRLRGKILDWVVLGPHLYNVLDTLIAQVFVLC